MEENIDNNLLPHLFRVEYTKMTAVICRHFGLKHIEIAEDIASETFLKAMEIWGVKGLPEHPTAWLYTVAKNKTKDYLKRKAFFEKEVKPVIKGDELQSDEYVIDFTKQNIRDSQLEMIFTVCDPVNSNETQICLALQVLCGFSVEEIANAFLSKKETIKKRLLRGRESLRNQNFKLQELQRVQIYDRLDTVLTTIYLLFNEGYFSKSNNSFIKKDLCSEAIRLALSLTENEVTNTSKVNALLALMCFQSSRLSARTNDKEETVLFDDQDRNLWDEELIEKGNYYLVRACSGNETSKYHLEASIAYWHTNKSDTDKWQKILQLYNQLILIEYSPIAALNRTFAFAKVYGYEKSIAEAEKLNLPTNPYYHSLLGFLYSTIDVDKAVSHYTHAINLTNSIAEKRVLTKRVNDLKK